MAPCERHQDLSPLQSCDSTTRQKVDTAVCAMHHPVEDAASGASACMMPMPGGATCLARQAHTASALLSGIECWLLKPSDLTYRMGLNRFATKRRATLHLLH